MLLWLLSCILLVVCALLSVAFFTLLERKVLSYSQTRMGPNKTTILGLAQPVIDGGKLLTKEWLSPVQSSPIVFLVMPAAFLGFMLTVWTLPALNLTANSHKLGGFLLLVVLGLSVYVTLLSGVASFSKFGTLGAVRAVGQSVSYEVTLAILVFTFFISWSGMLFCVQPISWTFIATLPALICLVAELNRAPFDFAEGESELISGFNLEYGSLGFTLLFLGEYGMIIGFSMLFALIMTSNPLLLGACISFLVVLLRSTLPRFRYDMLMGLCWFYVLPVACVILLISFVLS